MVPAAKAFDVVLLIDGKLMWDAEHPAWQRLGAIGERLGLTWLGRPGSPSRQFSPFQMKE